MKEYLKAVAIIAEFIVIWIGFAVSVATILTAVIIQLP